MDQGDASEAQSRSAHERWHSGGGGAGVRELVLQSWRRCRQAGVDPERPSLAADVDDATLQQLREQSPLTAAMPLLRELLLTDAGTTGHVLAVSDAEGRLLHVEGNRAVRTRMEGLGFTPGVRWDEAHAGTNAPGTALALEAPVQILSGEHWATPVHPWSCSAAPVHDSDGRLLGAVDLTGGSEVASPYALALVRAAVGAVQAHLPTLRPAVPAGRRPAASQARLQVLGVEQPLLHADGQGTRLTHRHAEILLVLAANEKGISGEALADCLSTGRLSPVTVRAEVSRLRAVMRTALGVEAIGTRPYRLLVPLASDADDVAAAVSRGHHRRALDLYGGPLLPTSEAPAVTAVRHELQAGLRDGLLRSGSLDSLWRWADRQGIEDLQVWERLARELPYGSPRRLRARARVSVLSRPG